MTPVVMLISMVAVANLLGLVIMGWDKWCARRQRRRVPERTLWLIALLSGSLGIWLGMRLFRHKTQHIQFVVGVPILVVLHAFIAWRASLLLF